MAAQLPNALKQADLNRFAHRASQLEKYRPIVSYWLEYYILQHILQKGLHTTDQDVSAYAVSLMDKLEALKDAEKSNDAIVDDVAAKAYIENFAFETFNRADEAQRSNKVTKQTADTFMAAITFFDLLSIWGEVDREILVKSKFAKFHAMRILKAFKADEDPNATNPVIEEPEAPPEDDLDAELEALEGRQNGTRSAAFQPPRVESETQNEAPFEPNSTFRNEAATPPLIAPFTPADTALPAITQQNEYQVSPIDPADTNNSRNNSIGGGYFPSIPSAPEDVNMEDEPAVTPSDLSMNPQDFYNTNAQPPQDAPSAPSPRELGISSPARPSRPTPDQMTAQPPTIPPFQSPPVPQIPAVQPYVAPARAPAPFTQQQQVTPAAGYRTDDESTMAATKHARWAISALNFEDVNTAVRELRLALQSLGAAG